MRGYKGVNSKEPKFYAVWNAMRQRCDNPNDKAYYNYGGRGIKVCKEWENVDNFYADMFPSYKHGLTLDRVDNDKGYSPANCKWSTRLEQQNNRRTNNYITYKGKTHTVSEWSRILGIKENTLWHRIMVFKWPLERAMNPELSFGRNQFS